MASVSIRDLSRNPGKVVDELQRTGKPALVTRRGEPVALLVRVEPGALEDFVLANAPEFVRSMRDAGRDLRAGRTRRWDQVRDGIIGRS